MTLKVSQTGDSLYCSYDWRFTAGTGFNPYSVTVRGGVVVRVRFKVKV